MEVAFSPRKCAGRKFGARIEFFLIDVDSLPALRAAKLEPSLEVFPENVDGRRRHILSHHAPAAHTCPAKKNTF